MSCRDVAAAIVDESLPRSADLQAHLEQCPRCRALARLHASALGLRLPDPPPLAPVPRQAILGEMRRRQRRRATVAGTAVAGAVAALVLLVMPRPVQPVSSPEALAELDPVPIGQLLDEVQSYTRRDLVVHDAAYAPFGALALWVRPPEPTALDSRPFRTVLSPLHPTQEPAR